MDPSEGHEAAGGSGHPGEKAAAEETKSPGRKAEQGAEEYCCSGILEQDFPELCTRAGMATVPKVTLRPSPSFPADGEWGLGGGGRKYSYFQPCIQVEREPQDPRSTRAVFLRGWKMEEPMLGVLSQCLPTLAGLQAVHLWKVGLSERLLPVLVALLARCPRLRTLSLEGNPLPTPAFHTLMGSNSPVSGIEPRSSLCPLHRAPPGPPSGSVACWGTPPPVQAAQPSASRRLVHLSLRNNRIGDEDARLIGKGLSTLSPSGRSLASLILSFNRISDLGAAYIARHPAAQHPSPLSAAPQGLRLNRSSSSCPLENNDIGDVGATRLAEVLAPFALMHDEVVERRRLLLAEALGQSLHGRRLPGGCQHPEPPSVPQTPKETKGQSEDPSSAAPDKLPWAKHGKPPPKKKELLQKEEGRQRKKCDTGAKSCPPAEIQNHAARRSRTWRFGGTGGMGWGGGGLTLGSHSPSGTPLCPRTPDPAELPHPLLAEAREHQGSVILPGNRALLNLNLAYNHVTERGLGAFLAALEEQQREKKPKVPGQEGAAVPLPGEEPHPSRQPGLGAAAGAAATAAPVARSAGAVRRRRRRRKHRAPSRSPAAPKRPPRVLPFLFKK
ncbi:LOW QUALITY PROTEIN: leucine-rich repeat-containing protein 71 [Falco cherrug]|uniref:LOW QUALITY PROTEIN: leucine-rich repeat-containing protein 71 n=1 Tax=Falco cherrug TaxID=345164 RepID=UPI00247A8A84|nr:LOW QUALITY PROTEIN: leucine-rich repeat-containing protein 71 [Falco cherrug]